MGGEGIRSYVTCELAIITNTPMSTMTKPTTSTAYCAMATAALGVLITSSGSSAPGASPEASCHEALEVSCFPFFLG